MMVKHQFVVIFIFGLVLVSAVRETTFNIDSFGADPTGVSDSYTAITNAINSAASVGGGTVIIPPGHYTISKPLIVSNTPIQIIGSSPQSSSLYPTFQGAQFALNIIQSRGFVIRDIGVVCRSQDTSGFNFENSFIGTVSNIQTQSCGTGVWIDNTGNFDLTSVNMWNYAYYGMRIQNINGDLFATKLHGNTIGNNGALGLYLSVVSGAKFTNSDFLGGIYGVYTDLNPSDKHAPSFLYNSTTGIFETYKKSPIYNTSNELQPVVTAVTAQSSKRVQAWNYNSWLQFTSVDCDTVQGDPWHIISAWGMQLSECWSGSFDKGTGIWLGTDVKEVAISNHQWQEGLDGLGNNGHGISITGGIMGQIHGNPISTSIPGEPTIVNLRQF